MEKWIVYSNTNIGTDSGNKYDGETRCCVFNTFEEARDKAREILKSYAYGEPNAIFDGNGILVNYSENVENFIENDDFYDSEDEVSYAKCMETVRGWFAEMFAGNTVDLSEFNDDEHNYATDWLIAYRIKDNKAISIFGEDDGPFNGYNPHIYSDMFDMSEPRNYITYIDDDFETNDADGFLEVRIIKSEN